MVISSNTLFHFTKSRRNLIGILEKEFQPRYCLEDHGSLFPNAPKELREIAIPMTCFCDLPLSNVGEHLRFYGRYGLGLSKEWGTEHRINPVLYLYPDSSLNDYLWEIAINLAERDDDNVFIYMSEIMGFVKPYEGQILRHGRYRSKRFYDEREWRYVPQIPADEDYCAYRLEKGQFLDKKNLDIGNTRLAQEYTLSFEPNDIRYIIVSKESEILPMIQAIEKIQSSKYDWNTLKVLSSRIISAERIASDF